MNEKKRSEIAYVLAHVMATEKKVSRLQTRAIDVTGGRDTDETRFEHITESQSRSTLLEKSHATEDVVVGAEATAGVDVAGYDRKSRIDGAAQTPTPSIASAMGWTDGKGRQVNALNVGSNSAVCLSSQLLSPAWLCHRMRKFCHGAAKAPGVKKRTRVKINN